MKIYRIGPDGYLAGERLIGPDESKVVPPGWTAVAPPPIPDGMYARWNHALGRWEIASAPPSTMTVRRVDTVRPANHPPKAETEMQFIDWLGFGEMNPANKAHAALAALKVLRRLIQESSSFEELKQKLGMI